jgi:hypothetical protein
MKAADWCLCGGVEIELKSLTERIDFFQFLPLPTNKKSHQALQMLIGGFKYTNIDCKGRHSL